MMVKSLFLYFRNIASAIFRKYQYLEINDTRILLTDRYSIHSSGIFVNLIQIWCLIFKFLTSRISEFILSRQLPRKIYVDTGNLPSLKWNSLFHLNQMYVLLHICVSVTTFLPQLISVLLFKKNILLNINILTYINTRYATTSNFQNTSNIKKIDIDVSMN